MVRVPSFSTRSTARSPVASIRSLPFRSRVSPFEPYRRVPFESLLPVREASLYPECSKNTVSFPSGGHGYLKQPGVHWKIRFPAVSLNKRYPDPLCWTQTGPSPPSKEPSACSSSSFASADTIPSRVGFSLTISPERCVCALIGFHSSANAKDAQSRCDASLFIFTLPQTRPVSERTHLATFLLA